ncbi:MAG: aldose 1-epimerase family protein [Saprospiraceae bacterium]|nr:aldose 1-epimerase family protein [Lewinella sp.]
MDLVTIENDHFIAKIDRHGAQLAVLYCKTSSEEFVWQRDSAFWEESAPICFPIVGGLKDGTYTYDGQRYYMNKHGVVRYQDFQVVEHERDNCRLEIKANENTLASYPFQFTLAIDFKLTDQGIRVGYAISNKGGKDMPAGLGYHPAFNINIEEFKHADYEIRFSEKESLDLYWLNNGLLELKEEHYLNREDNIPLSAHLFDDDALIFKNITSDRISLVRKNSDWKIDMFTGGAPHLGIWAKPAAPYVCIEPWYTYQDSADVSGDLFEKPGMFVLQPGEVFESFYEVRV